MDVAPFRRGRALLGFMAEQEALDFLRGTCVFEDEAELKSSLDRWASASKAVSALLRGPLAPPERRPISQQFSGYLENLSTQEAFKQTLRGKCTVEEVEIENVIAFQRNIDTEYAAELASKMKASEQFVIESCLPLSFQQNLEVTFDPAVPGISFSSFSPKLTLSAVQVIGVGGPQLSIAGQTVQQPGALFLIGTQANYVQVTELGSRFFLKNGYHRAYAAMLAGRKRLPAVLSNISDFAETGAMRPGFFPRERLMSETPPLLRDFLDDRLAADLKLRSMRKVIRVRADDFFVPR